MVAALEKSFPLVSALAAATASVTGWFRRASVICVRRTSGAKAASESCSLLVCELLDVCDWGGFVIVTESTVGAGGLAVSGSRFDVAGLGIVVVTGVVFGFDAEEHGG